MVDGPASGELPADSPGGGVFDGVAVVPVFGWIVVVLGVVGAAEGHTVSEGGGPAISPGFEVVALTGDCWIAAIGVHTAQVFGGADEFLPGAEASLFVPTVGVGVAAPAEVGGGDGRDTVFVECGDNDIAIVAELFVD